MSRMSALWNQLRRRRVPQVAALYLAAGFAVAEAADLFFPRLGLPDWLVSAVVVVVVMGFPVAIVLAWLFDIVPDRAESRSSSVDRGEGEVARRRQPRAGDWAVVGGIAIVAMAGAAFFASDSTPLVADRVLVAGFANRTGDPSLETVGAMAADWVGEGLARSGMVEVVPASAVIASRLGIEASSPELDALGRATAIARETGAGTLVTGSYHREGDSLSVQARVVEVARGRLIRTVEPVMVPITSPSGSLRSLSERVAGSLASRLNPRLGGWVDTESPPTLDAYQEYAAGIETYIGATLTSHYRNAADAFERAVALDSGFVMASLWLARTLANGLDRDRADSLVRELQKRPGRLTPYDRAFLDRLEARLDGDWRAAYVHARRMTEIAPSSDDAWRERALDAMRLNRPGETLEILSSLDPDRGWLRGWAHYWHWQIESLHMLGEHERELQKVQASIRAMPEVTWLQSNRCLAFSGLGRPDDAVAAIDEVRRLMGWENLGCGVDLRAHGHAEAADILIGRAVEEHRGRAAADTSHVVQVDFLEALYYDGRYDEARRLALALAPRLRGPAAATAAGVLGAIAARTGDGDGARRYDARLSTMTPLATGVRHTVWRARIAAILGDRDRAVRLVQQAMAEGLQPNRSTSGGLYAPLHAVPEFMSLRGYPAFDRLVRPDG